MVPHKSLPAKNACRSPRNSHRGSRLVARFRCPADSRPRAAPSAHHVLGFARQISTVAGTRWPNAAAPLLALPRTWATSALSLRHRPRSVNRGAWPVWRHGPVAACRRFAPGSAQRARRPGTTVTTGPIEPKPVAMPPWSRHCKALHDKCLRAAHPAADCQQDERFHPAAERVVTIVTQIVDLRGAKITKKNSGGLYASLTFAQRHLE